jgi:hypothetical protein
MQELEMMAAPDDAPVQRHRLSLTGLKSQQFLREVLSANYQATRNRPGSLSPSALRQSRARDRRRRGVALLKVELPIDPLVERLLAAGWLTEDMNCHDPAIVESALQKALLVWVTPDSP